jgi:TolB-like protein/DNA-binding winged helix-turn-helix (wHTH) protein/Tfp pilus assembly protein PilF
MQYRFGEFTLVPDRYELTRRGEPVALEPRVLEVLAYLVAHAERVVPRRELFDQLWPGVVVSDAAITRTIKEARRAVGGRRRAWIRTVYGRGFQFTGPVAVLPQLDAPATVGDAGPSVIPGRRRPLPSVAVLPFADLSTARDQGYFCDGLAEELIGALSGVEGLFVASRTSSFQFRSMGGDMWTIGERLNVATVLEGSVRKEGSRVRVNAQLISVADNGHLWSAIYERELEDVFAIQEEIAESVVGALRVVLSDRERLALRSLPRAEPTAYEWYLRGRQVGAQSGRGELEAARQMFRRALELDPRYAPALAGVAHCCAWLYLYWGAAEDEVDTAEETSRRAIALAPDLADAHMGRALVLAIKGRVREADAALEAAVRLSPRVYKIHYTCARFRWARGDVAATLHHLERAEQLNADYYGIPALLAKVHDRLGRPQDAARARQRCVEQAEASLARNPADIRALYLGAGALAGLGEASRAADWIERATTVAPDDAVVLEYAAAVHARGGRPAAALACLDRALALGYRHLDWIAREPDFDGLRGDPRFGALFRRASGEAPAQRAARGPRPGVAVGVRKHRGWSRSGTPR